MSIYINYFELSFSLYIYKIPQNYEDMMDMILVRGL